MYHTDRQRFGSWSWIINVHRWGIKEAGEIMVGVCGIPWHLSGVSPHSCVQGRTHTLHLPPHIMLLDQSKVFLDNGINSFSNLFTSWPLITAMQYETSWRTSMDLLNTSYIYIPFTSSLKQNFITPNKAPAYSFLPSAQRQYLHWF